MIEIRLKFGCPEYDVFLGGQLHADLTVKHGISQ